MVLIAALSAALGGLSRIERMALDLRTKQALESKEVERAMFALHMWATQEEMVALLSHPDVSRLVTAAQARAEALAAGSPELRCSCCGRLSEVTDI